MRIKTTNKIVRFIIALIFFSVFFFIFMFVPYVDAAILSVEPVVTRMTAVSGQEWSGSIRISNLSSQEVDVLIDSMNLISGVGPEKQSVPAIGESVENRIVSLAGWITLPIKQIKLSPQSSALIPVNISVPPYAGRGVHRAVVTFQQEGISPEDRGAKVATTITAGFLVDVIGNENFQHEVILSSFETNKIITTSFPLDVSVRVENNGTTLGVLDGEISISSLFGVGNVRFPVVTVQEGRYIRPGSAYENTYTLTADYVGSSVGLYRANVKIVNGGDILEDTTYFIVIPSFLIIVLLSTFLISVGGIRFAIRKAKKK